MGIPAASAVVVWGMIVLAAAVGLGACWAWAAAEKRGGRSAPVAAGTALAVIAAWMAATYALAASGRLRHWAPPPPLLLLVAIALAAVGLLGFSRAGRSLATSVPLWLLVVTQGFRLPLELVMHRAAAEGVMPAQMTFGGWNYDIVTGAAALALGALLALGRAPRSLVVAWNWMGALLLLVIVTVAIASMPAIHAFGETPDRLNTWVADPPFVWLPTVLVPAAALGHILVARRLRADVI